MKKISKFIYGGILLGAVALTGCENAEYDQLTNQAYILQTATNANSSQKLTVGNEYVSTDINVRLSEKATEASSFKLVYDAQLSSSSTPRTRLLIQLCLREHSRSLPMR